MFNSSSDSFSRVLLLAKKAAMIVEVIVAVLSFVLLFHLFTRQPVFQGGKTPGTIRPSIQVLLNNPDLVEYEVKDLQAPKVAGRLLKFLIWLAYTRFGQLAMVRSLLRRSNLDMLSGVYLPEKPTLCPTPPPPPEATGDNFLPNQSTLSQLRDKQATREPTVFRFSTVTDYVRAFKSHACTPTDIARAVLDAMADSDQASPPLRAIVDHSREVVLAMAEASTERWKNDKAISCLDGIPVAVKEEFRVEPYVFRSGTMFVPELANLVPETTSVRKLRDAGCVIIGVSNMQELGLGTLGSNPNPLHLTARNPYNKNHYAGGSSTGSAISVAAGFCPIALGSDGGGSVRIPAALCGVPGIKPTNYFIDSTGCLPLTCTVTAIGPLCASVLDLAITLDVMSRANENNQRRLSVEGLEDSNLEGLRVGVYWKHFEHADAEIVAKCKAAVEQLQSLGATLVEIKIPELEDARVAHAVSIMAEMSASLGIDVDKHFDEFNPETLLPLAVGYNVTAVEYINARKQCTRAIESLKHIFKSVDIIATPATACPAPEIDPDAVAAGKSDAANSAKLMRFSFLANLTGIPGLVQPVGYTSGDLPIALQLMGRWYEERVLLRAGLALETSGAFPLQKPKVFYDIIETASSAQ